jgi:ABC-type Fe3+ transport system permease subunit
MQATAHFVFWTIVLQVLIGFALAYLINKKFRGHDLWTTIILLPMMLSPAVVGNFWTFLYQPQIGLFNYVVGSSPADPASFPDAGRRALAPWAIVIVDTWMWTPYVMLICLAGLRSIPDYIYEAAEVDRASKWRQFWTITMPMVLPFIMLAVLFRGIENFKMFDMVNQLTGGGPGSTTELPRSTSSAKPSRAGARAIPRPSPSSCSSRCSGSRHLRQSPEQGEATMSTHSVVEPSASAEARVAGTLVVVYALITLMPLLWIGLTSFKTPPDAIAYPPKVVFTEP